MAHTWGLCISRLGMLPWFVAPSLDWMMTSTATMAFQDFLGSLDQLFVGVSRFFHYDIMFLPHLVINAKKILFTGSGSCHVLIHISVTAFPCPMVNPPHAPPCPIFPLRPPRVQKFWCHWWLRPWGFCTLDRILRMTVVVQPMAAWNPSPWEKLSLEKLQGFLFQAF